MKYNLILCIAVLFLTACVKRTGNDLDTEESPGIPALCIIDESPLQEEPVLASELITTLYLGDEFRFLGEIETDLFSQYYKIELFDGTTGWIIKEAVLFNAEHAAVIKQTTIYPELDSKDDSQVTLYPAEYVAIIKEDGDWVKVLSAGRKKGGWIRRENLSTSEEDVFIATLASSELLDEEGNIDKNRLPSFIHSLPDKNAKLAVYLQDMLEEEVVNAIAESILEYEMGNFEEQ